MDDVTNPLTIADFFSGAGAVTLAAERAGWRGLSFSEIEPYVSAVLAERWPELPNLGDIAQIGDAVGDWSDAILWTGGFPCQDLSVAGRRAYSASPIDCEADRIRIPSTEGAP